jgi:hypothetical protein
MVLIVISEHARFEAQRRGIELDQVLSIIESPQEKITTRMNRLVLQSKYYDKIADKEMLFRVIVESEEGTVKVISVYRTSKIDKYWIGGGKA